MLFALRRGSTSCVSHPWRPCIDAQTDVLSRVPDGHAADEFMRNQLVPQRNTGYCSSDLSDQCLRNTRHLSWVGGLTAPAVVRNRSRPVYSLYRKDKCPWTVDANAAPRAPISNDTYGRIFK